MSKWNGKKLAYSQLLLKRFRHFVIKEPIERKVNRDPCNHEPGSRYFIVTAVGTVKLCLL